MTPPEPTPPGDAHPGLSHSTLQVIALLIGVAASVLTPLLYLSSSNPMEVWTTALVAGIGWTTLWLLRRGYSTYMPHLVVYSMLTAATLNVLGFGSVRTTGSFLYVAAVAGAGIMLGRKALVGSVVYSVVSLGALTLAEAQGWLRTPDFTVGTKVWLTHSTVLIVVAILVFYSRSRAEGAFKQQLEELALRKRTEQERDRSNERFARIFHTSPSPMLAQSARNGAILDVNPAFERCYGYAREQVLGRTDTILWADQTQRSRYLEGLISHRRTDQEQATGLRADGTRFQVLISSELGDDPEDLLVITTVADITAQNEALERLRRSEDRFAKAFNFSPLKMTITRLSDGTFVEVNQARDPVQGFGRQELLGKSTLDTGGWLNPQDRQAFVELIQREGHVSGFETRMRHVSGEVVDAKMWAEQIEIDGEDCILSCFVNTTEEKRREALLLSVAQGMAGETGESFFASLTRHAALTLKADIVLIGELRADERIHTLSVWVDGEPAPPFDYDPNGMPCQGTLAQSELFVQESALKANFPDAELLSVLQAEAYVGQCLFDLGGTPAGVLAALWRRPISASAEARALMSIFASRANAELIRLRRDREIKHLNETLEQRVSQRTAELQKLNAELDSFAYSVSHDLKSPLRAIDGFTQLLQESMGERLKDEEREIFQRVLAATGRMSRLIADLLALARISQGPVSLDRVDLSTMALVILDEAQQRQPGRRLQWRVSPGLHATCDARLLRIALENLIGNAVKYSRDQPEPLIEVGQREVAPQMQEFFVRDNGSGFDMAHASKLFKPFQRLHMPSSGFEGTGIGLATVRRIVERHGGSIRGESAPGQGATFTFSLGAPSSPRLPAPPPTRS